MLGSRTLPWHRARGISAAVSAPCTFRNPGAAARAAGQPADDAGVRAVALLPGPAGRRGLFRLAAGAAARSDDNPEAAKQLVNLVFLGQYLLASLMAPSFAAGAITGEKERKSYEMLLASPLRPGADRAGQAAGLALTHLAMLIFSSLPIVHALLPLGGTSFYEVLRRVSGADSFDGHVRHDQPGVQQLFPPHGGVAGRVVPADPAVGARWPVVLAWAFESGQGAVPALWRRSPCCRPFA